MSDPSNTRLGGAEADDRGLSPVGTSRKGTTGRTIAVMAAGVGVLALLWYLNLPAEKAVAVAPPPAPTAGKVPSDFVNPRILPPRAPVPMPAPAIPAANAPPAAPPVIDQSAEMARRAPVMAFTSQRTAPSPSAGARPAAVLGGPGGGIGATMVATSVQRVKAENLGDPTYRLSAGTVIPCVLNSAIDTTIAGFVRCQIEQDIYSANGALVLLDAGTIVLGEYGGGGGLRQGQERVGVIWSRAETPNSVAIALASPASDSVGRAGMDGEVETYFWSRFGTAIMFSLIQDAMAIGRTVVNNVTAPSNSNSASYQTYGYNTQATGEQMAATALRNSMNIPPVLKKNQGERVSIFVRNDLDFSNVFRLDTR
jgi:type IV secretion system protein VirB10